MFNLSFQTHRMSHHNYPTTHLVAKPAGTHMKVVNIEAKIICSYNCSYRGHVNLNKNFKCRNPANCAVYRLAIKGYIIDPRKAHTRKGKVSATHVNLIKLFTKRRVSLYKRAFYTSSWEDTFNMEGSFGVRKGAWTEEEDILLKQCIQKSGEGKWHLVPVSAGIILESSVFFFFFFLRIRI